MSKQAKQVLITGAARRIGRTIAATLARAGWDILLHYNHSEHEASTLAEEIRSMGRNVSSLQANLEEEDGFKKLADFLAVLPPLALVHNASLFESNEADPNGARHRRVNEETPKLLTRYLFNLLPESSRASSVFLLDNTPLPPILSHYRASKEGLRQALPDLALACAPLLRVNAVALGPALRGGRESEAHFQRLVSATPLQKPSLPKEIANAVWFLLENEAITGQVLNVDSGMNLVLS